MSKVRRQPQRSYLFESLETRALMAADPLGSISLNAPCAVGGDDTYETNNGILQASRLGTINGTLNFNNLVMADVADWYMFTMSGKGTAANQIRIDFQNSQGNLDLQLYASTTKLVAQSTTTNNSEVISLNGLAAGTYYVKVMGNRQGVYNPSYNLTVATAPVAPVANPNIDLVGAGMSGSGSAYYGENVPITALTANRGTAITGDFNVQWYLSRDQLYSADDVLLSQVSGATFATVRGLRGGGTSNPINTILVMPTARPTGWTGTDFFIVMRTDSTDSVGERNEANNSGQLGIGIDSLAIRLTVAPPSTSQFTITLDFSGGGLSAGQRAIFASAAARWSQIIIGDLPDANYRGTPVDDVLIAASGVGIDGVGGILGQAGPDAFRTAGTRLPYHGVMQFDSADLSSMEADGSLYYVIMHEMGHVLGIGTLWASKGLLVGAGTANPTYTGVNALLQYRSIFGLPAATSIPVENTGGPGTADGHWRESVFDDELMTGYANSGVPLPVSRITVGSLADLGYQVNMAAADNWVKPLVAPSVIAARTVAGSSVRRALMAAEDAPAIGQAAQLRVEASAFRLGAQSAQTRLTDGAPRFAGNSSTSVSRTTANRGNESRFVGATRNGLSERVATRVRINVFAEMSEENEFRDAEHAVEASQSDVDPATAWSLLFDVESFDFASQA
ncbi:MAG: leishmanolysin-related zinc metalloendopeptidase [Pirellulales bacterium]